MIRIQPHTTVGQLAGQYPAVIPWLYEQNLEFCCGGGKRLEQVSRERRQPWDDFCHILERQINVTDEDQNLPVWEQGQEAALIEYILERFHAGHRRDLPNLQSMADKVEKVHGEKLDTLPRLAQTLRNLAADLEPHMQKEEQILFPMIHALIGESAESFPTHCGGPAMPMLVLRREHEGAGELLEAMTQLTDDFHPPAWACNTFKGLYEGLHALQREIHLHIHLENNVLFPMIESRIDRAVD